MHPFFKLLVDRPAIVTDHLEGYATLAALECSGAVEQLRTRALSAAIALSFGAVAVVLAGVAAMLWAVTPPSHLHAPWVLWLAPGLPALVALWCGWRARMPQAQPAFSALREQVHADIEMLREVSP